MTIDCGNFVANLDAAVRRAGATRAAHGDGKLRGLGIACFLETSRGAPNEGAEIRFESDGTVSSAARHAVERAGARDRLSADRRRSARPADRDVPLRAGRHRRDTARQRPWRRALDASGRVRPVQGGAVVLGEGTRRRGALVAGGAGRAGVRRRAVQRARQRARHRSARRGARRRRSGEPAGRDARRVSTLTRGTNATSSPSRSGTTSPRSRSTRRPGR